MTQPKRVLIVGGVAGGASCAARLRRLDESAEIILFDRGAHVSFANCGLPYYVGNVIREEAKLLVATPKLFRERFNIEVHLNEPVLEVHAFTVGDHEKSAVRIEKERKQLLRALEGEGLADEVIVVTDGELALEDAALPQPSVAPCHLNATIPAAAVVEDTGVVVTSGDLMRIRELLADILDLPY